MDSAAIGVGTPAPVGDTEANEAMRKQMEDMETPR